MRWPAAILLAVLVPACASPGAPPRQANTVTVRESQAVIDERDRRQVYVTYNRHLAPEARRAILAGKVLKGMSADQVLASWGEPVEKTRHRVPGTEYEFWTYGRKYTNYIELRFANGLLDDWWSNEKVR